MPLVFSVDVSEETSLFFRGALLKLMRFWGVSLHENKSEAGSDEKYEKGCRVMSKLHQFFEFFPVSWHFCCNKRIHIFDGHNSLMKEKKPKIFEI